MKKITNKKLTKKYTDGRKYVGEFRDGKRHGQGTVIFADRRKYVGKWKDDKPNGKGILTNKQGITKSVRYELDRLLNK